jgi:hypothetical protein
MATSSVADNSTTPTVDAESELHATTSAGTYQLVVDLVNMADGDGVRLRVEAPARSGGTRRVVWEQSLYDAQPTSGLLLVSPAIMCPFGARFALLQFAGTARAFPWSVNIP